MTERVRHAVIMAAGRGSRLMPMTDLLPKAMMPYLQSTLIANGIDSIRPHIDNIHVTVGYKGALLAQHLIEHNVTSVHNTDGHSNSWWIHHTLLRSIDEPVFVLTCDNVTELDFEALADDYFRLGAPPCLLVPVTPVDGLEGDYIHHEGPVVTKLSRINPAPIYCSGIQVLHPRRVSELTSPSGDFTKLWSELITQEQLYVSSVRPTKWFSVDTADHLRSCAELMQAI